MYKFKLNTKQYLAHTTPGTEVLYGGAAGGGKSYLIRAEAIISAITIPGLQIYVFRRTLPDLLGNHHHGPAGFVSLLHNEVQSKRVKFNAVNNYWDFQNGSRIFYCHCQSMNDVYKYQGREIHYLIIDEVTLFEESVYLFLRNRVRIVGLKLSDSHPDQANRFPRILLCSNPGNIGHMWVKRMFIDMLKPYDEYACVRMPKDEGGMIRQFISAKMADNPQLMEEDPNYDARLEGLGTPELVRAMRDGDWEIQAGGMFSDLWRSDYHVIQPFRPPEGWPIWCGMDWGFSRPFALYWLTESDGFHSVHGVVYPRGTVFIFLEMYGVQRDGNGVIRPNVGLKWGIDDIIDRFIKQNIEYRIEDRVGYIYCDPAMGNQTRRGGVFYSDMGEMSKAGLKAVPGYGGRDSRKKKWQMIRGLMRIDEDYRKPGLLVTSNCRNFIRTIPMQTVSITDPDDVDTEAEDHALDAVGYALTPLLRPRHEKKPEKVKRYLFDPLSE